MRKECIEIIKDIGKYDFIIGNVVSLILIWFLGSMGILFYFGIGCSYINFIINAYASNRLYSIRNLFSELIVIVSYIIRSGFICSLAIFFIIKNDLNFLLFIVGYTAQIISILIYGLKLMAREGVWFNG